MIAAAVFVNLMFLATVSCQGFAGCRESYFLSNRECLPCPDHCETCVSNTNCTKCTDNYYGVTCQKTCRQQDCECHKIYGYCTYGCPDGYFPEEDSPECSACPDNCDLCSMQSTCVSCNPRFYGDTCAQQCATYCKTCNKTTGTCTVCEEGYFNQEGECLRCPEGCVGCYDNRNCSGCRYGYLKLDDGQCIKDCDMHARSSFPRLNKQSERNEEAYACAENFIGQDVVIEKRQPCIRYKSCPSTVPCPTCGGLMIYQCNQTCRLDDEMSCLGESECHTEGTMYSLTFCLTTKGSVFVKHLATKYECTPVAEDLTHDDTGKGSLFAVNGLVIVFMATLTMMAMMMIIRWKWKSIQTYVCFMKSLTDEPNVKSARLEEGRIVPLLKNDSTVTVTIATDLSKPLTNGRRDDRR